MFLDKTECTGRVSLSGANVGKLLLCSEATFSNPGGQALSAHGLIVDAGMSLSAGVSRVAL